MSNSLPSLIYVSALTAGPVSILLVWHSYKIKTEEEHHEIKAMNRIEVNKKNESWKVC